MRFEWDPAKDKTNRAKHGLSFDEAAELFKAGVDYLEIYDEEHSDEEDRFIAVGPIKRGVIVVAYTERDDDVLRILSARRATKKECQRFEKLEGGRHERRDS
ncbi:MAG: BrnT family toxin [Candidatus Polarisedimenticolia bacterium]